MGNKFKKFRLIFFIALGIIIIILWIFAWLILADYETTDPISTVKSIENSYRTYNGADVLETTNQKTNAFETEGDVSEFLENTIADKPIQSLLLTSSYGTDNLIYILTLDGKNFAKLIFHSTGKSFFGFEKWELKEEKVVFSPKKSIMISAPKNAEVYVNGIKLTEQYMVEYGVILGIYENTPKNEFLPLFNSYKIDGFYNEPVITGIGANGEKCVVEYDEKYGIINLFTPANDGQLQSATKVIESFSTLYSAYASGDIPFENVAELIYEGSSIYEGIKNQSILQFEEHDSYEIRDFNMLNVESYDETQIKCDVSFNYYYFADGVEHVYPSAYEINMIETEKGWKIVNLEAK